VIDLTIPEVAAALQVSVRTVRREIDAGRLAAVKVRRLVRIPPHELDAYRSRQRIHACPSAATAKAGKLEFSTLGVGLAARLGPGRMRSTSSGSPATGSPIIELAARRGTASRKRSSAG
jgi:excisionase family DNA binding protein